MAIRKQIITTAEVLTYSPAGAQYPTTHIDNRIKHVEMQVANDIWGCTFADYLDTHLVVVTGATEWESCKTYANDAYVTKNGITYQSTAAGNKKDPETLENWEVVQRFDTACLNELYENFMRPWLAYRIYAGTLEYTTNNTGAGGLVKRFDDASRQGGTKTGTATDINANIMTLRGDEEMIYRNMIAWLDDNATTCNFPAIKALCSTAIAPRSNIYRRHAMK
jgi:hypothetical protein